MAVTPGNPPTIEDVRRAFLNIVQYTDELKKRCEDIGQWAQTTTAQELVDTWKDPTSQQAPTLEEAQEFIDTALGFSAMIDNTLAADTKLGPRVVKIRKIG